VKISIYCEGDTERGVKDLLTPVCGDLREKKLGIHIKSHKNNSQLLRKIGKSTENDIINGAPAVFCLIDLYGIHEAFTHELSHALGTRNWFGMDTQEKVNWLKTEIPRRCIAPEYRAKFHIHISVYEIEALMFADPNRIARMLKVNSIGEFHHPEKINDVNPPAKLLNELFRQHLKRRYGKTTDGVSLLRELNFDLVYKQCPNFKIFVDDLGSITPC
jgi:hypothetical protein